MASKSSREDYVYMAKLTEQAEQYEEMVEFMEKLQRWQMPRVSWRIISSIEKKEETRGYEDHVSIIKVYRSKIETELTKICEGILNLLELCLIPSASSAESKVFYLKMKGDYRRYLAEFKASAEHKDAAEDTLLACKSTQDIAIAELALTHPIRLVLALNFFVFYYEVLNSPDRACNLAKQVGIVPSSAELGIIKNYHHHSALDSSCLHMLLRN
ncbi:14-3-3-like protein, partial [Bienertia sinuspersici]